MSDWDDSDDVAAPTPAPIPSAIVKPVKSKWEGEDEDESTPASDWEESSEEEEEKPASAPVAPPKKKGTLKAKIAEKEAAKASRAAEGDLEYDEDSVLDPREKARIDKERELSADLENTATLFGAAALGGTSSKELDSLISANPRTKEDFQTLSAQIIEIILKRHENKPLYPTFVEHHVRQLAEPLRDVEVRKAASALTTLANEKQREQRDKTNGKKKPKSAAKPTLGATKISNKFDTEVYDEPLDDFGKDAGDFM